jgi:hypothetical protein
MVGVPPALQQTPRVITADPPTDVTVPPLTAMVGPIAVTADVVNNNFFDDTRSLLSLQFVKRKNNNSAVDDNNLE